MSIKLSTLVHLEHLCWHSYASVLFPAVTVTGHQGPRSRSWHDAVLVSANGHFPGKVLDAGKDSFFFSAREAASFSTQRKSY